MNHREMRPKRRDRADSDVMDRNTNVTAESHGSLRKAILWAGSLGPLGHLPASGTVSVALVGIPLYYWMHVWPRWSFAIAVAAFTLASVWLHHVGDRWLQEKDSRKLVWDELVGYLIAVAPLTTFSWKLAIAVFLIERVIDIVKVPPARWIERSWPGGWGVVGDDVVAGIYTAILIQVVIATAPGWFG